MKEQKKSFEIRKIKKRDEALKLADELSAISINIPVAAQENDRLFGAIHESDIQKALQAQGFEIEKKNIIMDEPIKTLGVYKVMIKIYEDVHAELKVWVVKE